MSPKVRLPSLSLEDWQGIEGLPEYEHRAFLETITGDVLLVSKPVNPEFLKYLRDDLGMAQDVKIIVVNGHGNNLAQRAANDPQILSQLRDFADQGFVLDPFIVGPDEEFLARAVGMAMLGDSDIAMSFGTKSAFRKICRQQKVPIAEGFEDLFGADHVIEAVAELFRNCDRVVIKGDYGASSAQNRVIRKTSDWPSEVRKACSEMNFKQGVVEVWLDKVQSSPSGHFFINGNEPQRLFGPWRQTLMGENQTYAGTSYPAGLTAEQENELWNCGMRLARAFRAVGYQGHLGFDFMHRLNIFGCEANARKGGVHYVRKFTKLQGIDPCKMIWGRDVKHPALQKFAGDNFNRLLDLVKDLKYSVKNQCGLAFYNDGLLKLGKIQLIIVADDQQEADYYFNSLLVRLAQL